MSDVTAPSDVADAGALSDAALDARLRELEREEQSISRRRTTLHARIDFVRSGGYASTDPELELLATLQETERELSEHRLEIHSQIDALRAERSRRRL
jgi:predicted  nucleic acid-binding Zn-ribbon protein